MILLITTDGLAQEYQPTGLIMGFVLCEAGTKILYKFGRISEEAFFREFLYFLTVHLERG
jgi:hypothetical protein